MRSNALRMPADRLPSPNSRRRSIASRGKRTDAVTIHSSRDERRGLRPAPARLPPCVGLLAILDSPYRYERLPATFFEAFTQCHLYQIAVAVLADLGLVLAKGRILISDCVDFVVCAGINCVHCDLLRGVFSYLLKLVYTNQDRKSIPFATSFRAIL